MTESNPWADQWQKAQQQFVSAWSDMAKTGMGGEATSPANILADSFELWRKACSTPGQPEMQQVMDKSIDVARGYFSMAEQLGKNMASGMSAGEAVQQWLEQLKSSIQKLGGMAPNPGNPDLTSFMHQWFTPAQTWQQMTSLMNPISQSMFQIPGMGTSAFNMGEAIDPLGKSLSAPGIGYFREPQEKQQKGIQLALDYQQANFLFNQAFIQVSLESIQGFQEQLMNAESGDTPKSLRELYDLWVEVSETHYAEFAMSTEYQSLYGDMVNRLMMLKKHYNEIADEFLNAMNLPSTSEVDTMQMRLQQLRRENIQLKKDIRDIKAMLSKGKRPAAPAVKAVEKQKAPASKAAAKKKTPASKVVVKKASPAVKKAAAKKGVTKKTAVSRKGVTAKTRSGAGK